MLRFKTIIFGLLTILSIPHSLAAPRNEENAIHYLSEHIPKLLAAKHIPGAAVVVVNKTQVLWQQGFGYTSLARKTKVTPQTLFSAQSDSKMFTALAILLAAQQKKLNLDESIQHYLPNFTVKSRFSPEPLAEMTLNHLLSHTAGFPHEAPIGNNFNPESPSFAAHINSIQDVWLRYPVGQRFAYSNLGYDLAGYILEQQTKMSFAKYLRQMIFEPLGMYSSTFDFREIQQSSNIAIGNIPGLKSPKEIPMVPAGGLYTNANDLGKFLQFQLNEGKVGDTQLLAKSYLDLMKTLPFPWRDQQVGYGLGVVSIKFGDVVVYNHNGGGFGFNSTVIWVPKYNFGMAILLNGYDNPGLNDLVHEVMRILTNKKNLPINTLVPGKMTAAVSNKKFNPGWLGSYITDNEEGLKLLFVDDKLGIKQADRFNRLQVVNENEFYTEDHKLYRYIPASSQQPAYIQGVIDGESWDLNEAIDEPPGPNKPSWKNYLGEYQIQTYKRDLARAKISVKNGYLYFNSYKLTEFKPGLYYAPNGFVLDLQGSTPIWNNAAVLKKI